MITEAEAKQAPEFIVDWRGRWVMMTSRSFTDYRQACAFARRTAKRFGSACLMPVIDGRMAAQWSYSDRYPRAFSN